MSQLPIVDDANSSLNETVTDIIKSNTNSLRNLIRKLFTTSASSLSLGIVGLLGYAIYRSYKPFKKRDVTLTQPNLSNYVEPDIGKFKRPREQIEEVFFFWKNLKKILF